MKKKKIENKSLTKPLIVIISVLAIVILAILVIYSIHQDELTKIKDDKIDELQKKVNNLTNYIEEVQVAIKQEEIKKVQLEYFNDIYGFNLILPATWNNYEVKERTLNFGENGDANSIDFYFTEDQLVFNLGIIEKNKWEIVKNLSYYQATKLGENNKYVFGYIVPNQANTKLVASLQDDIDMIKASFQTTVLDILEEELDLVPDQSDESDDVVEDEEIDEMGQLDIDDFSDEFMDDPSLK